MRYYRIILTALVLWMSLMALHASNVVTISGGEGAPDDHIPLTVTFKNDNPDLVAAQIKITLPDGVEPVDGSLTVNNTRIPDHNVTADMNGRDYVIVVFNTSLKSIPTGDGELLTFNVSLGDNPGHFSLIPQVKLSGRDGKVMSCESTGSALSVLAPKMELSVADIDFNRVPLLSENLQHITVQNTGTAPLAISDYKTNIEGLSASLPATIEAGASASITLNYTPIKRSPGVDGRLTFESNSVGNPPYIRIKAIPFSVNELHLANASGVCDEEVTISVTMNNMEPITAAEFTIQLPEAIDFVEGSIETTNRTSALSVESTIDAARNLRIIQFGLNNKTISGNDGEILNFRVKLNGRSGCYYLTPTKVILANKDAENMVSDVFPASVQISSPSISVNSNMAIGNVPLNGTNNFKLPISNYGQTPLSIEKIVFLDDIAQCNTPLPLTINSYQSADLSFSIKEPKFGEFATTMNIYSNDPDNRMKSVNVSGNFYSPNELKFKGVYENGEYGIEASLTNEEAIVAMQLDLVCPEGIATDESMLNLLPRAAGHSSTLVKVAKNHYRIVIFSLKNQDFSGNEGAIFTLGFSGERLKGRDITIQNIKLSSIDGVNITTPNAEIQFVTLPIPVNEVKLDKTSINLRTQQTVQLSATVDPTNTTDKTIIWSSSDESVATVSENGIVSAITPGTVTITATSIFGAKAECVVTVELNGYNATFKIGNDIIDTQFIEVGKPVAAPDLPEKEGYTFAGWQNVPETMPAHDIEIVGSYTVNSYKLTYTVNGETYKEYTIDYGTEIVSETYPAKEGFTFSGWDSLPETMPAQDVVVSGTFSINSYNVVFKIGDDVIETKEVVFGQAIVTPEALAKEGYTFAGWQNVPETMPAHDIEIVGSYTVNSYKLTYVVDGETYKELTLDYGFDIIAETEPEKEGHSFSGWEGLPETMPAHDVTASGSFSINSYNIVFKIGEEVIETKEIVFGQPVVAPEAPEKDGYIFAGWQNVPETMPAHDIEILGSYSVNTYNLNLYLNGELYSSEELEYGSKIKIENPEVPEGMKFDGWIDEIPQTMPAHDVDIHGTFSELNSIANLEIADSQKVMICTISGVMLFKNVIWQDVKHNLAPGFYIINGAKYLIKM